MLHLFINCMKINIKNFFHQHAFENIHREQSKLRTYALVKTEIGFEKYLSEIKNPFLRIEMTKFRLSNHNLMIEIGRHKIYQKNCDSVLSVQTL